jgi:hypothetical protein
MYGSHDARTRRLGHDLRCEYRLIVLSVDALDDEGGAVPRLEWLGRITSAADRCELAAAELAAS